MIGFIIGLVVGAAGAYYLAKNQNRSAKTQLELNSLYDENEKLRKRYKEAERQNEDLLAKLTDARNKLDNASDSRDDLKFDLDNTQSKLSKALKENADLKDKLEEYKEACATLERRITTLKAK